jgi:hypothetical protein
MGDPASSASSSGAGRPGTGPATTGTAAATPLRLSRTRSRDRHGSPRTRRSALLTAGPEGPERRVGPVWEGAVRVAGADFGAVAARFEKDGLVEGWATVTGTWSGEQLRAERQDVPVRAPAARARWVTRPCPPPEGGWPATERRGDIELSYDLGDLADTGAATAITLFHPARTRR